jgi:hypothetical protein
MVDRLFGAGEVVRALALSIEPIARVESNGELAIGRPCLETA